MKRMFYSLSILALVALFSACAPKPEILIQGSWKLSDVKVENFDEYAKTIVDAQVAMMDAQVTGATGKITALETEIKGLKDKKQIEAKTTELNAAKKELEALNAQKAAVNVESVKKDYQANIDMMKGQFKMVFNADKTYENPVEGSKGTYDFSADKTKLITKASDGKTDTILVTSLEAEKMVLSFEQKQGDMEIKMSMHFEKEKATAGTEAKKEEAK